MNNESDNFQLATKFVGSLKTHDWAAMKNLVHKDAVWTLPGESLISGAANGVDAILHRWQTIIDYGIQFELKHILTGKTGAALSLHNTARRGELFFDEHLATVMDIQDHKIIELNTYLADVPMLNTFFVTR